MLSQQLKRIGCQVSSNWPPLPKLPDKTELIFCAVLVQQASVRLEWMGIDCMVPVIAVVNYENPTILELALRMGAKNILMSPFRASGVLSILRQAWAWWRTANRVCNTKALRSPYSRWPIGSNAMPWPHGKARFLSSCVYKVGILGHRDRWFWRIVTEDSDSSWPTVLVDRDRFGHPPYTGVPEAAARERPHLAHRRLDNCCKTCFSV